ncbi:MAG: glycine--tRNA ligase subunit beta, partial [Nitrospirae bacterium]|nr:glycine--tRNA ligase subunit beta [Nitrospirota bacterium]
PSTTMPLSTSRTARMLQPAIREMATRLFEDLMALNVAPAEMETGFTPRRLILMLKGLPTRESDRDEEMIGPPVRAAFDGEGRPTRAAEGFARKCGVEIDALRRVETDKGEYLAATRKVVGRPVSEVLAQLIPRIVEGLSWAKTMRWGVGEGPWVRPIHGVVALCDGEVVPCRVFDVEASDETLGHPVLSPRPFAIRSVSDYRRNTTLFSRGSSRATPGPARGSCGEPWGRVGRGSGALGSPDGDLRDTGLRRREIRARLPVTSARGTDHQPAGSSECLHPGVRRHVAAEFHYGDGPP